VEPKLCAGAYFERVRPGGCAVAGLSSIAFRLVKPPGPDGRSSSASLQIELVSDSVSVSSSIPKVAGILSVCRLVWAGRACISGTAAGVKA
jgi:hypothetical protein